MSARTVTETLSVDEALGFVRDVLAQTDGAAVVLALRFVGPLSRGGWRCSLTNMVGTVGYHASLDAWVWQLRRDAYEGRPVPEVADLPMGDEPTREAADRKLCEALTALGWRCMEAP